MRPIVLSIAAIDPGAGAGLLADVKTIEAHGCWATGVATAVTAQTVDSVSAWLPVEAGLIGAQIDAVFHDFEVAVVKIGLLGTAATVQAVAEALRGRQVPLLLDPVLGSTSGRRFLDDEAIETLRRQLIPQLALITPNRSEAHLLCGVAGDATSPAEQARQLHALGADAVLVTGGHAGGGRCEDLLFSAGAMQTIEHASVVARTTHGTGCVHSAALASRLALGDTLHVAATAAARFVEAAIRHGVAYGSGGAPDPHWATLRRPQAGAR